MSAATSLPLRDVHLPPIPSWWPLPLGWWLVLAALAVIGVVVVAAITSWWALLGLVMVVFLARPVRSMITGATGMVLVGALKSTGLAELAGSVGLLVGAILG